MPNTVAAQPTQRANALEPEKIFICNTSNIDSMRHGRPETVMFEPDQITAGNPVPNGIIVELGKPKLPDHDHVRAVEIKELDKVAGAFIIVSPEINVEQYRRIDNSIANHMLVAKETYTAYELQVRDRIEFSQAYFANPADAAALTANTELGINAQGKLDTAVTAKTLRVVSVREQRKPLMMALGGEKMPESYMMVKVEVIL